MARPACGVAGGVDRGGDAVPHRLRMGRHDDLDEAIVTAMTQLSGIRDGLPARAQMNAWWPYHGRGQAGRSTKQPVEGPQLTAGEDSAATNYRMGAAHLSRALVAAAACHAGVRWRFDRRRMQASQLPRDLPSPAACDRMARVLVDQLRFLIRAVDDPDVTPEVLDMLAVAVDEIGDAHERFTRAAPPIQTGGRAARRTPTKPARRRRR